jgi:hypothetical protein
MADPNIVNIKGLPRVEEIVNGNFLIVENDQGTNTLDFVNFVVGPNNVSFYSQITNLSAQNISLSASTTQLVNTQINSLSTTTSRSLTALDARITSLSTSVTQQLTGIFYRAGNTTIAAGQLQPSSDVTFSVSNNVYLTSDDVTLMFGSSASGFSILYLDNLTQVGNSVSFRPKITIPAVTTTTVRWNVFKSYTIF